MNRLFVALRPPAPVRRRLLAAMGGVSGAHWQDDDQLHVTLRYIGPVDARTADDVVAALEGVTGPPPTMAVRGVGRFETGDYPRAIWAGLAPGEPLAALHRKIDRALVRIGLAPERRAYLPHITLARLRRGAGGVDRFIAQRANLSTDPFTCDRFSLYESHLSSGGATYIPVAHYPLSD